MKFADIPGQETVKARLRDMADTGRIPHAILLEGPEGTGKFALARAFAQYLHCANPTNGEPCGKCPSCLQHQNFNHIDTLFSFPFIKKESSSKTIADDYRTLFDEFITESPMMDFKLWCEKLGKENAQPQIFVDEGEELIRRLGFMTRRSKYKIVLLWLPERLKEETANKLLKLIEEPSADTIFIMTSDNPRGIISTIYSRVQRIEVPRYSATAIADYLRLQGISPTEAAEAARLADGNMNVALRLVDGDDDTNVNSRYFELFTQLTRLAYAKRVAELRQWSVDAAALGRESSIKFLAYCCHLIRESYLYRLNVEELRMMSSEENAFVTRFNTFINEKNVEDFIELFDRSARDIAANANAKIIFFDIAVRTIMYLRRK